MNRSFTWMCSACGHRNHGTVDLSADWPTEPTVVYCHGDECEHKAVVRHEIEVTTYLSELGEEKVVDCIGE